MAAVVNVDDHNVIFFDVFLDGAVADEAGKADSEGVDGCPNEEVLADVATVALEPGVQSRGSLRASNCRKRHSCRAHQATSRADSVGRGTKLLTSPSAVTLLVKRIISSSDDSDQRNKDDNIFA